MASLWACEGCSWLGKAVSEDQTKFLVENLVLACQRRRHSNVGFLQATSSICIRIIEVHEVKPIVPVFML
ncbi:hypothetical protein Moror_8755 [Moniliophthora roreri MCA 2997]|uniref:Uncharacterized protein n=2 Tax=Moniliophthora roreri TaxID=221103 RepID=A0A0W0FI16_MONRR|nr:hypothetical protein Moror_8755 [Moniliophthora roreri MCA 2997]KAI3606126.1 hypothetical protein WG66_003999 [Moniliophthora roreri]KAI3622432.1 hypothetical protein WG66_015008 [Moniliophthora roreri]